MMTSMIVITMVMMTPIPISMVIAGRGLELCVSQMSGDIHSITETITKFLSEGVIQRREVHKCLTGRPLQLSVHPVGVRDKQNLSAILIWGKYKIDM